MNCLEKSAKHPSHPSHSNHRRIPLHETHGSTPILSPRPMVFAGWEGPWCLRQTRTIDDGPAIFSWVPVVPLWPLFAAEQTALRVTFCLNDCLEGLLCLRSPLPPRRRPLPCQRDPIVLAVLRNALGGPMRPRSDGPRFVPAQQ